MKPGTAFFCLIATFCCYGNAESKFVKIDICETKASFVNISRCEIKDGKLNVVAYFGEVLQELYVSE